MLVSVTQPKPFKDLFCVEFKQIYNLQVFEPPEELKLVIRESFGRNTWQNLAQVFVPFSEEFNKDEEFDSALNNEESKNKHTEELKEILGIEFASDLVRSRLSI